MCINENMDKRPPWTKKDLIGLEYLTKEEIEIILYTAHSFKEVTTRQIKKVPALRGKTVVNLFYEPSTRTRISFELAAKRLSADVINVGIESSSVRKGETLIDTGRNIEALKIDIIVVRHNCSGAPNILARSVRSSVVNAGDGWHEHPTQALLDMFTLKEKLGKLEGLKISIIGDIAHSRVARSNIWGLTKLGAKVTVCAPKMLIPEGIEKLGVKATTNLEEALEGALKLKEISYIPAEGYAAGEMKHGPIALIDEYRAVVCVACESDVYEKTISNLQEIKARRGKIIAIASAGDVAIKAETKEVVYVPRCQEIFSPLLTAIPLQLIAYHIAVKRGCDVDQPRNLAKSVTVE